jgi:hypothetical protein
MVEGDSFKYVIWFVLQTLDATSVRTAFCLGGCHSTDIFKICLVQILFGTGAPDTDILQNSAKLM